MKRICPSSLLRYYAFILLFLVNPPAWGESKDFSIVALPDPQHYASKHTKVGLAQTQWIKENVDKLQIKFVTSMGDNVDAGYQKKQFDNSKSFYDLLNGVLPYGIAPGNHDLMDGKKGFTSRMFVDYFGPQRFKKYSWYGGASESGFSSCQFFTGGGTKFLAIQLTVNAPKEEIGWAIKILAANSGIPTILTTHQFLTPEAKLSTKPFVNTPGRLSPNQIWDQLVKGSPQIFMVLSGHYHGEAYTVKKNQAGLPVHLVLQDYQDEANGGNGWLRLFSFHTDQNKVEVKTYSPTLKQYKKGAKSDFIMEIDLGRLKPAESPPVTKKHAA